MQADSLKVIGRRIGAERKALGLTQSELASRIGITMARLANYEDGRGCLRCGIAFDICRNLVVSEKWLATGDGAKNQYRDVASQFPKTLLQKPFLEMYDSQINRIYEEHPRALDSFVPLLRYDDLHPDTWRIACFKMLNDFARSINDQQSLSWYWMRVAEQAGILGLNYSNPPRSRLVALNEKLTVLKDGREEPFSYEKFFDDLSLIGLDWTSIEQIAAGLETGWVQETKVPIPVEELKEHILSDLKEFEADNAEALYRKIHCK